MTVYVTGAAGQLGQAFVAGLADTHDVIAVDRDEFDLTDMPTLVGALRGAAPSVIVNCAAFNAVDQAEADPLEVFRLNALVVHALASLANELGAVLVHFSSDFVFDGQQATPYAESDAPHPLSVYGLSKLMSEGLAAAASRHYILRLSSLFGGPQRRSYVDRIVEAALTGRDVPVFADRVVSPSYTEEVVAATQFLLDEQAPAGVYHCVLGGYGTWADVAHEIVAELGAPASAVRLVTVSATPQVAHRPKFCALSTAKLAGLGYPVSPWQTVVRAYARQRVHAQLAKPHAD
jgi:dTDP-4-dehydrorhamnose reductase